MLGFALLYDMDTIYQFELIYNYVESPIVANFGIIDECSVPPSEEGMEHIEMFVLKYAEV